MNGLPRRMLALAAKLIQTSAEDAKMIGSYNQLADHPTSAAKFRFLKRDFFNVSKAAVLATAP